MKTRSVAVAIVCFLMAAAPLIAVVSAGTATGVAHCWIGINVNDQSGVAPLHVTVYVFWTGVTPSGGTVDVTIYDPDGATIGTYTDQGPSQSETISFSTDKTGTYLALLEGYPSYHVVTKLVASGSIVVVPESILGTLMSVMAGFAAFGTVRLVKSRRK